MLLTDIFYTLYNSCDIVISSFNHLINMPYIEFFDFLQGDIIVEFTSLINNVNISLSVPNIALIDIIIDSFFTILEFVFMPLPSFYSHLGIYYTEVPIYICLISAICNTFIFVAFFKLMFWLLEFIK